jgi:hypothetical protein
MKEHPILFSGPMVRAILEGRKTQTRRVLKPQPLAGIGILGIQNGTIGFHGGDAPVCKFGMPSDRLWVRETFMLETNFDIDYDAKPPFADGRPVKWEESECDGKYWLQAHYRATDPKPDLVDSETWSECVWRPSIFMPRWASRITLEVTDVRAEKLHDINHADAVNEGVNRNRSGLYEWFDYQEELYQFSSAQESFQSLWESINGPESWQKNPWLWVITFRRV